MDLTPPLFRSSACVRDFIRGCAVTAILAVVTTPPARAATPASAPVGEILFARRIAPLLQAKCFPCHGEDEAKRKGGLDLRTHASLLEGGDSGAALIQPGAPEESPLYLAVTREHVDWEPMPPKENDALTDEQRAWIRDWILAGAPWPEMARTRELAAQTDAAAGDTIRVATSGGTSREWNERAYKPDQLWAYRPLRDVAAPGNATGSAAVDAFVEAALARAGLAPAPRADRSTLLRRATFDLTGLPPSPDEVHAFVTDPASDVDAFAQVVERLLASPHYGEQMARQWLDVARYADSSGLANDFARGSAWRYRDYVVRAFNRDLPYDQFVRDQIAGDELAPNDPERVLATGFLRMGPWELTGMEVAKVARQKFLDDVTDSVGQTFLAHPLQCARCHDHKFDPVPTRDYYSLQAAFATTQPSERAVEFLPVENRRGFEERRYVQQRAEYYRGVLARLDAKSVAAAREWYREQHLDPARFESTLAEVTGQKNARGRDAGFNEVRAALLRAGVPENQIPPKAIGFTPEDYGHERIARKGIERLRWEEDRYEPFALAVYSGRTIDAKAILAPVRVPAQRLTQGELEETHVLPGGDPFSPAAPVTPGVLSAAVQLGEMKPDGARVPNDIEGRRAALAQWIASPDNPLTARTYVNRIWQWHFGQGLAANPNNFGATGKRPSHPELLDWLAGQLIATGWSTKALHRIILNSAAYARSSRHPEPAALATRDPEHTLLAVARPRRLTAEELRDAMLAVSGELNREVGGIPVRPEINPEAALQPRQVMGTYAEAWQPSPRPEQRNRRSLYVLKLRGQRDPFMETFNAPNPDLSCERREASIVTPQVFSLFNSTASLHRAVAWAERLHNAGGSREAKVERAFLDAFGRAPTAAERSACIEHWQQMTARHQMPPSAEPPLPRDVVREAVDENTGEKFKFVEPLEAAADFVPDRTLADVAPEIRGLAEVCLVLLNANEFCFVD